MNYDPVEYVPLNMPDGILPWTKSCFVCGETNRKGFRLRSRVENNIVIIDYCPTPDDVGWRGIIHGGIGITLMDEVMTWAAILYARKACVSAALSVRMRKPIRVGMKLRIEGWVSRGSDRLVITASRIVMEGGDVLNTAEGKYMPMDPLEYELCEEDFTDDQSMAKIIKTIFGRS